MTMPLVHLLPHARSPEETRIALESHAPWFYPFAFEDDIVARSEGETVDAVHDARARLLFPLLDQLLAGRWSQARCLDIGCHEGWFTSQVAIRGAREVLAMDVRDEHLERAGLIRELAGLHQVTFEKGSVYELPERDLGTFDLTLCLGLLYHLDEPMAALRALRSVTRSLCAIETQVARAGADLGCTWGADTNFREGPGIAVVSSDQQHVEGDRNVVLVPTLQALYDMLHAVGFDRLYLCVPDRSLFEQYPSYDRVVLVAQVIDDARE